MSYTKITTGFRDHETVLTAAHLQHMENGIADNDAALVNRVRTDTNAQGLGTSQKRNARTNIDVPSTAEMTAAVAAEADLRSAADAAMETKTDGIQDEVDQAKENISDLQSVSSSMVKAKTVSGNPLTIKDALAGKAKKLTVQLNPKQNLNGFDRPWIGGSGKNKAAFDQYDSVLSGITVTYNAGAVTLSGTSTALRDFSTSFSFNSADRKLNLPAGEYVISIDKYYDLNAGGNILYLTIRNTSTNASRYVGVGSDLVYTTTIKENEVIESAFIRVASGTVCSNVTIKPMIALASESDGTFEPYSNICPIEGFDSVEVVGADYNIYDKSQVIYGKNWLNGTSANRAVFVAKTEKGKTLHLRAIQHGNTHRVVIVGADKFGSNAVQSFNKNFQPGLTTVSYEVTADEYVICQFERYNDPSNSDVTQEDVDCWNIALSYSEQSVVSLNLVSTAESTVYGGTVTFNEDGTGSLDIDRACVTLNLGDSELQYSTNTKTFYFTTDIAPGMKVKTYTEAFTGLCDRFESYPGTPAWNAVTKPYIGFGPTMNVRFSIPGITDPATAFLYVNGSQVCYELATPLTYALSADQISTLLGENHLWTDGSDIELIYRAEKYGDAEKLLSTYPVRSAGPVDIISIDDGADDVPVNALTIAIEPKQNLNGYDKPWIGGSGKNLYPIQIGRDLFANNVNATHTSDSDEMTIVMSDETSSGVYASSNSTVRKLISTLTGAYTISLDIKANEARDDLLFGLQGVKTTKIAVSTSWTKVSVSATLSGTNPALVIYNNHGGTGTGCTLTVRNLMIEAGSTATDYEPYENICSIEGWNSLRLLQTSGNMLDMSDPTKNFEITLPAGTYTIKRFNEAGDTQINSRIELMIDGTYQYIISGEYDNGNIVVLRGDVGWGNSPSQTILTKKDYRLRVIYSTIVVLANHNAKLMMVPGAAIPTAYVPYVKASIYPISFANAGTVYGGALNVLTGELKVDRAFTTLNGGWSVADNSGNLVFFKEQAAPLGCPAAQSNLYLADPTITAAATMSAVSHPKTLLSQQITNAGITGTRFMVFDNTFATLDAFNTFLAAHPMQVVYQLATPITYQLTPQEVSTLLGNNTFSCDAGKITLSYRADPSLLINKLLTAITAYGITV